MINCNIGEYQILEVQFPSNKTGLSGIGYTIKDWQGNITEERSISGIVEIGNGVYIIRKVFSSQFNGVIIWDTGEFIPLYAYESINVGNRVDTAISSRASQTSVNAIPTNPLLSGDTRLDNLDNLDATVSSRATQLSVNAIPTNPLLDSNYIAPDNASITAIKAKTDNLPVDPASNTQVNTRLASADYIEPDNLNISLIKEKVNTLENTDMSGVNERFDAVPQEVWEYEQRELTENIVSVSHGEKISQVIEVGTKITGQIIEIG